MKKFFLMLISGLIFLGLSTGCEVVETNTDNVSDSKNEVYQIEGETLGEYGKKITLNANSDMPVDKYLYKLPEGTYKVTTTYEKVLNFYIVKDEILTDPNGGEYPESLDYVQNDAFVLTAGENDFNGYAKKEIEITLESDESIQLVGTGTLILEKSK